MQKSTLIALLVVMTATVVPLLLLAQTRDDSLQSQVQINSYIVKETGSSKVLMAKDIDIPVSPASLTKILTCIMAIESGRLDQDVLITKESTMVEPSKAGFIQGDKIKLVDLVKAAMVNSSNDAAFAIAIHLSGNIDSFVASMNYRAKMIGMKNSRFTNPAGFDKGIYAGNISTAEDLLRLTEYAVRNPVFNQVARLDKAVFMEQTTHKVYCLKTHNKLLDKYPYAVGIKTGYTTKAGGCLIARAIKNDKDILLVMLNAKTDRWNVAANLFDMAFMDSRPNPAWFSAASRGDSGLSRPLVVKEHRGSEAVAPAKAVHKSKKQEIAVQKISRKSKKQEIAVQKISRKSKKQVIAEQKISRKSKKQVIAVQKISRKSKKQVIAVQQIIGKSKKQVIAVQKISRKSKKQVIAVQKISKKSKRQVIAEQKISRKSKKRELVASKPVRKNKKKVTLTLSCKPVVPSNQISKNDQAYRNVAA
ncbi:MAG: D-alanyl-D-alanine carboxypeptidase [Chlorobium sp.]